jgi:hypothetical protein
VVSCSTEVQGDVNTGNDRQTRNLTVAFYDNEVSQILHPSQGQILYFGDTIRPKAVVQDNSQYSYPASVKIYCQIRNSQTIYLDSLSRNYNPGTTDTINFPIIPITGVGEGVYQCSVWVVRNNDLVPTNDYKTVWFNIRDPNGIYSEELSPVISQNQKLKTISLRIYNVSGRLVSSRFYYNITQQTLTQSLNQLNNLSAGIYFIHTIATPLDDNSQPIKLSRKLIILSHN